MDSWNSRRSPVLSKNGICSSSQPLASAAGVRVLQNGGTAADAAVAMAAALNVLEPCSTGIGGDAFALYFDAATKKVTCLQGNGASSLKFDLDLLNSRGIGHGDGLVPLDPHHGLCVTVPGAAALWEDLVNRHGRLNLTQVLAPAIELAEDGFPISPITAQQWSNGFLQGAEALRVLKRSPKAGDVLTNPDLAETFRTLAELGAKEGFYTGRIAEAIVAATLEFGGVLDLEDLAYHTTACEEPSSTVYKGIRVYETPPPTHGVAALIALRLIEEVEKLNSYKSVTGTSSFALNEDGPSFDFSFPNKMDRGSEYQAHVAIECMRVAFADCLQHISDPRVNEIPLKELLSQKYIQKRALQINTETSSHVKAMDFTAFEANETVYFCVVDREGNACSMINSNYMGFGSGIIPNGTGFTLHNRGHNFSLERGHPNQAAPRKRPYHTIIPALMTHESDGSLYGVFGNMGGFMQPMGHVQLLRNLVDFRLDPQAALDAPRWYVVGPGRTQSAADVATSEVLLEQGYGGEFDGATSGTDAVEGQQEDSVKSRTTSSIVEGLKARGHVVGPLVVGNKRSLYGRGQIILRNNETGVLWGGSDPRADGCAMPVP